jgi:hypothetical protein
MSKQRNPKGMGSYKKLADGRVGWRRTKHGVTQELSAKTPTELQAKVNQVADLPIVKNSKSTVEQWFKMV